MELEQAQKTKFASLLQTWKSEPVPCGKPIYEWDYTNEAGEVVHEKRNVQGQIQSFERQTRFKEKFNKGELENDKPLNYMDISALGDDYHGLDNYIASVVNRLKQDIQNQSLQKQNGKDNNQGTETQPKGTEASQQSSVTGDSNGGSSK